MTQSHSLLTEAAKSEQKRLKRQAIKENLFLLWLVVMCLLVGFLLGTKYMENRWRNWRECLQEPLITVAFCNEKFDTPELN